MPEHMARDATLKDVCNFIEQHDAFIQWFVLSIQRTMKSFDEVAAMSSLPPSINDDLLSKLITVDATK